MAERFVEYYEKEWGVIFQKERIYDHFFYVLTMPHTFAILDLENSQVKRFILAYPAQYCRYFSCIPENTISIYVDFINIDNQLWSEFLKNMDRRPFRNVFALGLKGAESFEFLDKESFMVVGDVQVPVRRKLSDKNLEEKRELVVVKKILNLFKYRGGK